MFKSCEFYLVLNIEHYRLAPWPLTFAFLSGIVRVGRLKESTDIKREWVPSQFFLLLLLLMVVVVVVFVVVGNNNCLSFWSSPTSLDASLSEKKKRGREGGGIRVKQSTIIESAPRLRTSGYHHHQSRHLIWGSCSRMMTRMSWTGFVFYLHHCAMDHHHHRLHRHHYQHQPYTSP